MERENYNVVTGVVVNNDDPYGGNRIQVRLGNAYDGTTTGNDLMYCTPLMPKLVHIVPKIDELVLVFLQKNDASNSNRFYVGPILSQPQRFFHEMDSTARTFMDNPDGTDNQTLENPDKGDNIGSVPDLTDVSIIGRDNSELRLREREVRIMCGYKEDGQGPVETNMKFNRVSPAFIQMQYNTRRDPATIASTKEYDSNITLFADRINLVSRHSDIGIGELDNNELITEDKMNMLLKNCHPLVYGDKLTEYLKAFRTAFLSHTHPYSMLMPVQDSNVVNILNYDFNEMLSKSVKTC